MPGYPGAGARLGRNAGWRKLFDPECSFRFDQTGTILCGMPSRRRAYRPNQRRTAANGVGTDTIQHAREMFAEHALLVVLVGSLGLGVPENVMGIASGGFGVPLFLFAPVFLFGRSTHYFVVA